jgi:hypothetical protein
MPGNMPVASTTIIEGRGQWDDLTPPSLAPTESQLGALEVNVVPRKTRQIVQTLAGVEPKQYHAAPFLAGTGGPNGEAAHQLVAESCKVRGGNAADVVSGFAAWVFFEMTDARRVLQMVWGRLQAPCVSANGP